MSTFIQSLINFIFQTIVFSIIPFIWWLITARKKENFFIWIGLKKPEGQKTSKLLLTTLAVFIVAELLGQVAIFFRGDIDAGISEFNGMGLAGLPGALVYSYGQTAFTEEILFRGFLLKRLSAKFGFKAGTIVSSAIFGLTHLILLWNSLTLTLFLIAVVYPMIVAILFSWLNEKKAGGSILPSWCVHGTINLIEHVLQL